MRNRESGQATTEVALLLPLFLLFLFAFAKMFALLILVQKLEIASFYAARRWQLESHRNVNFESDDRGPLLTGINNYVCTYMGYDKGNNGGCSVQSLGPDWGFGNVNPASSKANFLGLADACTPNKECSATQPGVTVQPTQVWNIVTVTACMRPFDLPFYRSKGLTFCSTKYVPNRDRPIAFKLPGLQQ